MKIWSELHQDCAQVVCEQAASLPDYYPPVMRVVRAEGQPCVKEVREHDGVVTVSGEVALTLLYQTEDEKGLCAYRTAAAFTQTFSLPENSSGSCDAYAARPTVTCRLTSARRVSFKAALAVYLTVAGDKELSGPERQDDMLYLVRSVEARCGLGCAVRRFHISERGECDSIPAAVLESRARAVVTEITAAGGKTLVKGELSVRALFVTKEDQIGMVRYTFPLSQLIDLPFGEGIDTDVRLRVGSIEVEAGESMDGSKGRLAFEIDLSVIACATESRRFELMSDAFSTTHALDAAREQTVLSNLSGRLRGSVDVELTIPAEPDGGLVIDADAIVNTCSGKAEGGKLKMEGECAVLLLCQEDIGRITARELTLPFAAEIPSAKDGRAQLYVCVWSALPTQEGVRLTLRYEAALWQDTPCDYLCSAMPDRSRPLPELHRAPVTVYFADKGELIWDIAKKYRVAPQSICKDNALEGDTVTENRRLLIM